MSNPRSLAEQVDEQARYENEILRLRALTTDPEMVNALANIAARGLRPDLVRQLTDWAFQLVASFGVKRSYY